jgi:hypothetical protein
MAISARKKLILGKLEASYGVDSGPLGANALLASNVTISALEAETVDRELLKPYLGASSVFHVGEHITLSFNIENQSFGTDASAPAFADLLRACGMSETLITEVGSEAAVYAPRSEEFESVTLYYYEDNILHKVLGCRGTFGFGLEPNTLTKLAFNFTGLYAGPVTESAPVPDWSAFLDPTPVSPKNTANFNLHDVAGEAHKFSFELGHEVAYEARLTSEEVKIGSRATTGSITIDAPPLATMDFFERVRASVMGPFHVEHGKNKGKIVEFDAPNVQLLTPKYGDANGTTTIEMGMSFVPLIGNDEFTLTYR